ncbi:MAG: uroporphyrinogen-III synthase [Pseudomonadota bacterium]
MDRQQPQRLLIPRPEVQGVRFARAVEAAMPGCWDCVLAPVMEIRLRPIAPVATGQFLFTSANGVRAWVAAQDTRGRAFCVGPQTTAAAREAGFQATQLGATVAELGDVLSTRPKNRFLHVRGAHVRGALAQRLRQAGHEVEEVVAYDQAPIPLPAPILEDLGEGRIHVVTLFSPRSARLLMEQVASGLHHTTTLVCLSPAVAQASGAVPDRIVTATEPTRAAMLAGLAALPR